MFQVPPFDLPQYRQIEAVRGVGHQEKRLDFRPEQVKGLNRRSFHAVQGYRVEDNQDPVLPGLRGIADR